MIILTDLLQPYLEDTESISNEDLGALIRYIKGYDCKPSKMVQVLALALKKDDESLVQRATEREETRKVKNRIYNARVRLKKNFPSLGNDEIDKILCERYAVSEVREHNSSSVSTGQHQLASVSISERDLNHPSPSHPLPSPHPKDCSCRSPAVQSAPARMRTLGELVSEDEIIRFSLPLRKPDEDADWYEGTLREHYQMVSDTPVRSTWQNLWRVAVNDLRKNGAFVIPRGFDSSSDSFA